MVSAGKVVNITYCLTDTEGNILDKSDAADPFTYLHGEQQIVPGLEQALEGLKVGDKKKVEVSPELGYGETDPSLQLTVKRTQFPKDLEIKVGMQFEAASPDGHGIMFTIKGVEDDKVHIDGNHPMAGKTLHFDVEILAVRDVTEEEKSHGHAHAGDGHHH